MREHMTGAFSVSIKLDGTFIRASAHIITCEGKVIDFNDATRDAQQAILMGLRDLLVKIDP